MRKILKLFLWINAGAFFMLNLLVNFNLVNANSLGLTYEQQEAFADECNGDECGMRCVTEESGMWTQTLYDTIPCTCDNSGCAFKPEGQFHGELIMYYQDYYEYSCLDNEYGTYSICKNGTVLKSNQFKNCKEWYSGYIEGADEDGMRIVESNLIPLICEAVE